MESCKLKIQMPDSQNLIPLVIVSEASVVEFYKQAGEYSQTVDAEFVDEFGDSAVYIAEGSYNPKKLV